MITDGTKLKLKRGVMMDIFLEDRVEKQIQEIQKIENLKDEHAVIYRAIQNYFDAVTKKRTIYDGGIFEKTNKTSFNGSVNFSQIDYTIEKIGEDELIERLPQNEIYGLDAAGMIWIFHNRLFPVKFSLLCLAQMMIEQNTPWIDLEKLKKYTQDSAENFVRRLKDFDLENDLGVNAGFPKSISKINQIKNNVDNEKILLSYSRSKKRFSEQFIGRKLRVRQIQNEQLLSEHNYMGGACFEMKLIHAKLVYEDNHDKKDEGSFKLKKRIVVTLNERGQKFASLKNNLMDFVYGYSTTKPQEIFSEAERKFYLDEIVSGFEFENEFVKNLIKGGTIQNSHDLKNTFKEQYLRFLKAKFADKIPINFKLPSSVIRIRSLVIMARLIEFGIFKKQAGTKTGPYILCQT